MLPGVLALLPWILGQLALVSVVSFVLYGLYKVANLIGSITCTPPTWPPQQESLDATELYEKWTEEYGPTFRYAGFLGLSRLYTIDHKALNYVLSNTHDYQKPQSAIIAMRRILGDGLLLVEGDAHKKQRKVLLRDKWIEEIVNQNENGVGRIDALSWMSRTALDVVGLAGFNYDFGALAGDPKNNELHKAFNVMFRTCLGFTVIPVLRGLFPILSFLPAPGDAENKLASNTMFRIGSQLLADSKAAIAKSDRTSFEGRDILSLLVRANAMPDLPVSQRLSDEDVLAQIPTFMVAGHETTGVALTWALFALTQNKEAQNKLREELSRVSTDNPTMDDLNGLPYLDCVVRETLRLHAPVASSMRVTMKDDILPLDKPYIDEKGNARYEVKVKKGQNLIIPIITLNRDKSAWGEDATEFKPERWEKLPKTVSSIPGLWGNMLTFLGGPKACIGYRFSIVEVKALLFTLLRAFEFDLAVPASNIIKKTAVVQRPLLVVEGSENSNQLPLLVRPMISQ